jgi:methionyl-tRNA synthetase
MNPTDLLNPRCKLTGTKPVIRSTKHLFLDLPKLSDKLQSYIDTTSQLGGWSANCVQVRCIFIRKVLFAPPPLQLSLSREPSSVFEAALHHA